MARHSHLCRLPHRLRIVLPLLRRPQRDQRIGRAQERVGASLQTRIRTQTVRGCVVNASGSPLLAILQPPSAGRLRRRLQRHRLRLRPARRGTLTGGDAACGWIQIQMMTMTSLFVGRTKRRDHSIPRHRRQSPAPVASQTQRRRLTRPPSQILRRKRAARLGMVRPCMKVIRLFTRSPSIRRPLLSRARAACLQVRLARARSPVLQRRTRTPLVALCVSDSGAGTALRMDLSLQP